MPKILTSDLVIVKIYKSSSIKISTSRESSILLEQQQPTISDVLNAINKSRTETTQVFKNDVEKVDNRLDNHKKKL